jgi:ferrous-iron efflux pump FieF
MSIANPFRHSSPAESSDFRLRRWASFASISVATTLIISKLFAYMVTDSVSVMTSLMDSTFDVITSCVTMFSIIHAATPADEEHRFGHGKIEALAALGQAIFIFGSAGYLFFESVHRFIHPQAVSKPYIGILVMVLSIVLTFFLIAFQRYVIQKTKSVGISADHLHYKGDLLVNIGVLVALVLGYYSPWPYFDPLFAAVISFTLLFSAWKISHESFGILMDQELPAGDRTKIESLVRAHAQVQDIHDLRTRHSGQQLFIEFHLELDGNMTLTRAHDITEEIEMMLYKEFPKAEVLIHQEPAGLNDYRLDDKIKK